ncbi:4'-phosphopantetheinyl transferase superfamily protein [Streptomyces sp. NPDC046909]|uniref:4'-phosphopantetheinyl transferase family protein n=1 Tax=Streptomyces sp. NPDC046909 TaxID=3155617 RepID=UPI0033C2DF7A
MIEELLPDSAVAVETYGDDTPAPLFPEEAAVVARVAEKRRREFTGVRSCARRAMEKLGVPRQPVLPGPSGAPQWPAGLIGSMTHCDRFHAAALARATDLVSLGIDAETHEPLPDGVLAYACVPAEAARLRRLAADRPDIHWDRLLFSAKESVYKAWFPLTGQWLDFTEADIELFTDPGERFTGGLRAELLVPGPIVAGRRLGTFEGRWTVQGGFLATAVVVPHA